MRSILLTLIFFVMVSAQDSSETVPVSVDTISVDTLVTSETVVADTSEKQSDSVTALTTESDDSTDDLDSLFPETVEEDSLTVTDLAVAVDSVYDDSGLFPEKSDQNFGEKIDVTVVSETEVVDKEKEGSYKRVSIITGLFLVALLIICLLIRSVKKGKDKGNFLTRTRISIMDREVQLVCRHIEEHYADPALTPETVCDALSTGLHFVENLFHKELDMTIEGFINHVRIHHAVNKINEGYSGDPETLMKLCGYEDLYLFEKDFFSVTGVKVTTLLKT